MDSPQGTDGGASWGLPRLDWAELLVIELCVLVGLVLLFNLRGQMILGLFLGVVAGIGSAFLGLPYPVVIGVLAGVFESVPMFGSLLGAVPAIVVALFQPFPTVLWVLLFFFAVNQAESYLLAPRISGESLGLSPLYTLVALLLGIELAGFLGALVAVPIAALLVDLTKPSPEPSGGLEAILAEKNPSGG